MVLGVTDGSLRKIYLQEDTLTFDWTIGLAIQFETIGTQNRILNNATHAVCINQSNVYDIATDKHMQRSPTSNRKEWHTSNNYKASKQCTSCGKHTYQSTARFAISAKKK